MNETTAVRRSRWRIWLLLLLAVPIALYLPSLFTPVWDGAPSDHFDGERFNNIPAERTINKSPLDVVRWLAGREAGDWSERRDVLFYNPPRKVETALRVTMVNHATVLIQTDGLNILTDPVWSERLSPVPYLGPGRYRAAGIKFDNLPPIDLVLISHNHYDHLDMPTLRKLARWHDPTFVVPVGNVALLNRRGIDRVIALDWWDTMHYEQLRLHAVPAQHWSKRGIYDTNRALWCGYVIDSSAGPVYFAGDTGMGPHFELIAGRLGQPILALLPIGAYLPRWFMSAQHIDPSEAVSAHKLLGARHSMAIHHGTFKLGDDDQDQAARELLSAMSAASVSTEQFLIPANGESKLFEVIDERSARIATR